MQAIKSKDSQIEIMLRKALWNKGLRYRKNVRSIFGTPDIAFIKKKVAVFCDSEFWHGYDWPNRKNSIKTNKAFWIAKIERNIMRDISVNEHLTKEGWIVLRFWEKDIKHNLQECVEQIVKVIAKEEDHE